jgi:thiamine-monophosphate kinase
MRSGAEFERIEAFVRAVDAPMPPGTAPLAPGDDGALVCPARGESLVLSSDLSIEEVHFRRAWLTWESIGYRATAAALSDLAAMAARPLGVLFSLAVAPEIDDRVCQELALGVGECLRGVGAGLLGGDVSRSPGPAVIDVVAVGAAVTPVGRGRALIGDELWVTGTLGGPRAAVTAWDSGLEPDPRARRAFERPVPRIAEALWLSERAELGSLIDLSDGLAADAQHVAAASGVGLELEAVAVPLHEVLEGYSDVEAAIGLAAAGGEDYELLMAARPGTVAPQAAAFEREFDVRLTRIGSVTKGRRVVWLASDGTERQAPARGFDHFAGGT